jgi:ABC-2 type transport system permease protein
MDGYRGPPSGLGRYGRYLAMRAKVRLAYRADFLVKATGELLIGAIGFVFLWTIFRNVPDIKGWHFHEVLLVWGVAELATGLFFVSFQGLWALNQQYILGGDLDRVLLRPLDPYTQILLDHLNLEDLPMAFLGAVMVAMALQGLPAIPLSGLVALPLFVVSGVGILAGVLTAVGAIGFRVHHRGTAIGLVYQGAVFNRYPLDIFQRWIRIVFTWVVPWGFVAYYPAGVLLGRVPLGYALVQPILGLGALFVGHRIWSRALGSYRSPGS